MSSSVQLCSPVHVVVLVVCVAIACVRFASRIQVQTGCGKGGKNAKSGDDFGSAWMVPIAYSMIDLNNDFAAIAHATWSVFVDSFAARFSFVLCRHLLAAALAATTATTS
jgi:hypothetical protein